MTQVRTRCGETASAPQAERDGYEYPGADRAAAAACGNEPPLPYSAGCRLIEPVEAARAPHLHFRRQSLLAHEDAQHDPALLTGTPRCSGIRGWRIVQVIRVENRGHDGLWRWRGRRRRRSHGG